MPFCTDLVCAAQTRAYTHIQVRKASEKMITIRPSSIKRIKKTKKRKGKKLCLIIPDLERERTIPTITVAMPATLKTLFNAREAKEHNFLALYAVAFTLRIRIATIWAATFFACTPSGDEMNTITIE